MSVTPSEPKRRGRGFEPASGLLKDRIRAAGESRGFAVSRLLTHWAEVVAQRPVAERVECRAERTFSASGRCRCANGLQRSLRIAADGQVYFCESLTARFGNILEQDAATLRARLEAFEQQLLAQTENRMLPICRNCSKLTPVDC